MVKNKITFFYGSLCSTHTLKALRHGSKFYLQITLHHACLSFVSVHQVAPPLTEVADIQLQLSSTIQHLLAVWHRSSCAVFIIFDTC